MNRQVTSSLRRSALTALLLSALLAGGSLAVGTISDAEAAGQKRQPLATAAPRDAASGPATGKRQHKPASAMKAKGAGGSTKDMTPWEKFCWNIHKDDFWPHGYANCVAGLPD